MQTDASEPLKASDHCASYCQGTACNTLPTSRIASSNRRKFIRNWTTGQLSWSSASDYQSMAVQHFRLISK